ncbi:hypothetical protein LTR66_013027 [Elasticomyces elasticus]|nr:hypothetical protein LTR66_013027 [Elasticomyces elasticus]KAK4984745.1 hypothetical protein LTR50_006424 [Elasticomyces elasticus]KAK5008815.1 hypothetical protein LTR28_003469 [Elasticomyces elasticus]
MAEEPLTPGQDQSDESCYADYSQQDLPGSEAFVTGLMEVMTGLPIPQDGIRIIPKDSDEQPVPGISVRECDINMRNLPKVHRDELPLPLDDPRRIYASEIPGVRLTHPGGYIEGGPGPAPSNDTYTKEFIKTFNIRTPAQLQFHKRREIDRGIEELRKEMQERKAAVEHNVRIQAQIDELEANWEIEKKTMLKKMAEKEAKKEQKERDRLARERN